MAGTLAEIDKKIEKISEEAAEERKAEKEQPEVKKIEVVTPPPKQQLKPGQVLTQCPNCEKKQRHQGEFGIVATRYLVFMGPNQAPVASLMKIACPFCGVESFRGKDLELIREKARQSGNLVVVPQGPAPSPNPKKDN